MDYSVYYLYLSFLYKPYTLPPMSLYTLVCLFPHRAKILTKTDEKYIKMYVFIVIVNIVNKSSIRILFH